MLVDDLKAQIEATPYCASSCDWLELPTPGCNKLRRRKKARLCGWSGMALSRHEGSVSLAPTQVFYSQQGIL